MPPGARSDARRNRARLLDVAADAFATGGLAVPLDEIARRAGVGAGTLYRHFPTKEALFEAVVQARLQRLVEAARGYQEADRADEALFAFLDLLIAQAGPKRDLVDALTGAGVDLRARLAFTAGELRTELGTLLGRAQQDRSVRSDTTVADLMALVSGVLLAMHRTDQPGTADPHRALAVIRDGLRTH